MKSQLLFSVMVLAVFITSAQNHFFEGYIVKAPGDTVKGYIKEDMNSHLADQVLFKANTSENVIPYTAKDIKAFGFEGNIFRALNYFDEVDSMQKERFGKLLVEGYYTLYELYFSVADHYFYVTSQQGKNFFLYDDRLGITVEGSKKGNYRNHLYFIGQSCPNAMNTVETMTFSERDVAKFVQKANNCLQPGSSSLMHIKKAKMKYKGVYLFAGGIPLGKLGNEVMGQLMVRYVSPSISRNASLNIGIGYTRYGSRTTTTVYTLSSRENRSVTELYGIPIQLQYNFSRSWFQPYFYIGFGAVYEKEQQFVKNNDFGTITSTTTSKNQAGATVPLGLGIEIYPTSHLLIKADFRYELFYSIPSFWNSF